MDMQVHPDILETLTRRFLPYLIRIQDMDTPWPAQLWINDECVHREGVVMFNIGDRGYLTAEYFAYDNTGDAALLMAGPAIKDGYLVMAEGDYSIPVSSIRSNPKANTTFTGVPLPDLKTYKCDIHGWVGGSDDTEMSAAVMTLTDLPDLHLPRTTLLASDEERGLFTMRGTTSRKAVLTLKADDWNIELAESRSPIARDAAQVYHATVTKENGSLFTLPGDDDIDNSIVDALYRFLSFQSGRWVTLSAITCFSVDPGSWVIERGWTGKLTSRNQSENEATATDWTKWPALFQEFWNQYNGNASREHLKHAVYHYVGCQRIFDEGGIDYSLVAAQSTLQALTRWWNELRLDHRFDRRGPTFRDMLLKAVSKAELGIDSGKTVDKNGLQNVLQKAATFRNDIDHGRGGNIGERAQSIVALRMYCHNLARLLILAKLGDRDRNARGNFYGPDFIDIIV